MLSGPYSFLELKSDRTGISSLIGKSDRILISSLIGNELERGEDEKKSLGMI